MPENPLYAITITFNSIHSKTPKGQFKETYKIVCMILEESCDYEIYPEYRVSNGSIHYHGTIDIKDKIKWYRRTLVRLKNLGFYKIKEIEDLQGWNKYCEKELNISKAILEVPLPLKNKMWKHDKKLEQVVIEEEHITKVNDCVCIECMLNKKKV